MKIESWRWAIGAGDTVEVNDRSRSSQFGDGSTQTVLEGVNPFTLTVPISWAGDVATGREIIAFLKSHFTIPFKMVPPAGELGLYKVKSGTVKYSVVSSHYMKITFTAETAVGIYGGGQG